MGLPENCSAVYIRNLCKRYNGRGPDILQNYHMTVQEGTIYGLLGASGCGKTTVLSCVVGLCSWTSGDVLVFGRRPGSKDSGIPGKLLGYMPQECALYQHLKVREVFQFYSRLYNMTRDAERDQWSFLCQLLDLPKGSQLVCELSGGEKRRVSLALALIHSPSLILLDEPTLGLDPLLREKIWDYLHTIVRNLKTTIVITTHYIEETRSSNMIGVMRKGQLIAEEAPSTLLRKHGCELLEQVVLKLCRKGDSHEKTVANKPIVHDENANKQKRTVPAQRYNLWKFDSDVRQNLDGVPNVKQEKSNNGGKRTIGFSTLVRIHGLNISIFLFFLRHPSFFGLSLILPTIHGALCFLVIGSEPLKMPLGVVNHELGNWTQDCSLSRHDRNSCDVSALSCKFLNLLEENSRVTLKPFDSEEEALNEVHWGNTWGFLSIPTNYSVHASNFALEGKWASNSSLYGFRIPTRLDYSQYIASMFLTSHLMISFNAYLQELAWSCGLGARVAELPLFFRKPVYGMEEGGITAFIMPGIILTSLVGVTGGFSALVFIADRKQGTLNRARVAGLQIMDLIVSYLATHAVICLIQIAIWQCVLHFVFGFIILGPIWIWLVICLLAGLFGTTLGIFIGTICKDEVEAMLGGFALLIILLLLGGGLYPIEGRSQFWQAVGYILPTYLPTNALRSVIVRGVGLTHQLVWPGLVALLLWTVFLLVASVGVFKRSCR